MAVERGSAAEVFTKQQGLAGRSSDGIVTSVSNRSSTLIPEVDAADVCLDDALPGQEHDMSWWMIPAMVTVDVYVVCLAIVYWAIKTAPLVPDSYSL